MLWKKYKEQFYSVKKKKLKTVLKFFLDQKKLKIKKKKKNLIHYTRLYYKKISLFGNEICLVLELFCC